MTSGVRSITHSRLRWGWRLGSALCVVFLVVACSPLVGPGAPPSTPDQIAIHLLRHPPKDELLEWQAWLPVELEPTERARLLDLLEGMPVFDQIEVTGQQELEAPASDPPTPGQDDLSTAVDSSFPRAVAIDLTATVRDDPFGYAMHFAGSDEAGWILVWLQGPDGSWAAPDPTNS